MPQRKRKSLFQAASALLLAALAGCATGGLEPLVLDAHELHTSLAPKDLAGANHGVPLGVPESPHVSTKPEVVASIVLYASQGQLGSDGICAALFAVFQAEEELGFYGLEATTIAEAERIEGLLRGIWAVNVQLDRARVHRGGRVLVVVWNDGVAPACWQAVNEGLLQRLGFPDPTQRSAP